MKKIYLLLALCLFIYSCNDEWKDEAYMKKVSFVKSGVYNAYIKYDASGGVITYQIPLEITGSTGNGEDVTVTVALDTDTLTQLNFERFRYRDDLFFLPLASENYNFKTMTTVIPKGEDVGLLEIDFKVQDLDLVREYLLPLKIESVSHYGIHPRKHYKKSLIHIVPFNDYSGAYETVGNVEYEDYDNEMLKPIPVGRRTTKVIDENTIFFFAGVTEEEAPERSLYKVRAKFHIEGTDSLVTLSADSSKINFEHVNGRFSSRIETDRDFPYLQKTYTIMTLEYLYDDLSNPHHSFRFRFKGTMTMERKRNILIPDEDQQIIF